MNRSDVRIGEIAAWLYQPDQPSGTCVVMAHGFSLTRHDGLEQFAEAFADAGATVLLFDHRYLGDSGGQPRQRFRKAEQLADWQTAVAYARGLDGVAPDRVVLWGYSFSGGHSVTTAAADFRIAAVMLLCPFLDGLARTLSTPPKVAAWIIPRSIVDVAGRHNTIPVTGPLGANAAMSLLDEGDGFAAVVPAGSPWRNEISPGLFLTVAFHRPWTRGASLRMPVWVGVGDRDISVSRKAIGKFVDRAHDASLHEYEGDHFTVFLPPVADRIIADQVEFLRSRGLV